jgi:phage protein D
MNSEFRIYFDNQAADATRLDRFREVRVDQAIGLAAEAELEMEVALDRTGVWTDFTEDFIEPLRRVRVEAKTRPDADFVPLIDGPVVGQRFELSGAPNESKLILVVHDDSALLNQEEAVELFENQTASDIAQQLFQNANLDTEVDSVTASGAALERVIVQRGTPMQLLRELARRHGMFVFVKPGDNPGRSIGVFARPDLTATGLPELLLIGAGRNVNRLTLEYNALRPVTARAGAVSVADKSVLSADSSASTQTALGDQAAHDLVTPGAVLLARTREEEADLNDAAAAAVDDSSWVYTAEGELNADVYAGVLVPHQTVSVAGAGNLSGRYLISRVQHVLNDSSYRQIFTLRRNGRSGTSGAGGVAGGIF